MNNLEAEIDKLLSGELPADDAAVLMEKINSDPELKIYYQSEKASQGIFEHEISKNTRSVLRELLLKEKEKTQDPPKIRLLFTTGIAASFLILIASIFTINVSHSDIAIADKYNINTISARDGDTYFDKNFNEALKSYFLNDFKTAQEKLLIPSEDESLVEGYKEWLSLMIILKTEGSNSIEFKELLSKIILDKNHEFHTQGVKLNKDINIFWRNFIVGK